jgi:hypothetical protein
MNEDIAAHAASIAVIITSEVSDGVAAGFSVEMSALPL